MGQRSPERGAGLQARNQANGKRYLKIPLNALQGAPWDD